MPSFSHVVVEPTDTALLQELYELGRNNPIPGEYACSEFPHPLLADLEREAQEHTLLAIYDGAELRAGVSFDDLGRCLLAVAKRYGSGPNPHPSGVAMVNYQFEAIKELRGKAIVLTPNPMSDSILNDIEGLEIHRKDRP